MVTGEHGRHYGSDDDFVVSHYRFLLNLSSADASLGSDGARQRGEPLFETKGSDICQHHVSPLITFDLYSGIYLEEILTLRKPILTPMFWEI